MKNKQNKSKKRYLSWGLGVQSTYILVLAGLGMIEPVDAVITGDTQWERKATASTLIFYSNWAREHGLHVEVVTAGNIREKAAHEHIHIPFWTETGAPLNRQCTNEFKIKPVKRAMRRLAGYDETKSPHPRPGEFENLIGISWDEWTRMSTSPTKFVTHRYPLIEEKLTRWDCIAGFEKLNLPVPGKSACVGCPYRDAEGWLDMKKNSPDEFEDACLFDEENRNNPLASRGNSTADKLYVWRGAIPLRVVDFEQEAKKIKKEKKIPLFVCTGEVCWT